MDAWSDADYVQGAPVRPVRQALDHEACKYLDLDNSVDMTLAESNSQPGAWQP